MPVLRAKDQWSATRLRESPGSGSDTIWWGHLGANDIGLADQSSKTVSGTYRPVTGNFDGNAGTEVLWYGTGSTSDFIWWLSKRW